MFLSTAGPSTFDFAVGLAGSIESGLRRMLAALHSQPAFRKPSSMWA